MPVRVRCISEKPWKKEKIEIWKDMVKRAVVSQIAWLYGGLQWQRESLARHWQISVSTFPSGLKWILKGWSSFVLVHYYVGTTTICDSRETEVNDESTLAKTKTQKPKNKIQPTNQPPQKTPHYKKQNFPISELCISRKKNTSRMTLNGTFSSLDNIIVYVELVTALHKSSKLGEKENDPETTKSRWKSTTRA